MLLLRHRFQHALCATLVHAVYLAASEVLSHGSRALFVGVTRQWEPLEGDLIHLRTRQSHFQVLFLVNPLRSRFGSWRFSCCRLPRSRSSSWLNSLGSSRGWSIRRQIKTHQTGQRRELFRKSICIHIIRLLLDRCLASGLFPRLFIRSIACRCRCFVCIRLRKGLR